MLARWQCRRGFDTGRSRGCDGETVPPEVPEVRHITGAAPRLNDGMAIGCKFSGGASA